MSVGGFFLAAILIAADLQQPPASSLQPPAKAPVQPVAGGRGPEAGPVPLAPLQAGPDIAPLVPPPAEYTLSLRDADWRVHVNLRPGEPQPLAVVDLLFDISGHRDSELGEPQPASDAKLMLTITGPGPKLRYLVRPLGDAGAYGVHWTPSGRGLWTLALAPYKDAGPSVSFQVGAGEPMPASSQGQMVQASRMVVAAGRAAAPAITVKQLMEDLGKRWQKETDAAQPDPAELKAMARLLKAVQGHPPQKDARDAAEFESLAAQEIAALDKGALPDAQSCLKCHLKFRDSWVADLSKWPEVKR
jgi:hypothetical protein